MEKLSVIGAGTMGHSIALNAAWMNQSVRLYGMDDLDIDRAWSGITTKVNVLVMNDVLSSEEGKNILSNITITSKLEEALDGTTFVIEAIPEDLGLKQKFYQKLDSICSSNVILASNTSGLSPTEIAKLTQYPERVLVTHFWNPAHLIPLVEVVKGQHTSIEAIDRAMKFLRNIKKKPILVKKDIPGFVGNRLQYALFREAQFLLEEGVASMEDIDDAVTYSIGRRLPITGPFMTADLGGLDVFHAISNYLFEDLSTANKSMKSMANLVKEKNYGVKTGKGFYQWDDNFIETIAKHREEFLIERLKVDQVNEK
jgi:3-hydroxybutyryl-CoA dehydrogenase